MAPLSLMGLSRSYWAAKEWCAATDRPEARNAKVITRAAIPRVILPSLVGARCYALGHDPVYGAANGAPPCAGLRARGSQPRSCRRHGDDLVAVLFRVVKRQAADREIDDLTTVPRSRPG